MRRQAKGPSRLRSSASLWQHHVARGRAHNRPASLLCRGSLTSARVPRMPAPAGVFAARNRPAARQLLEAWRDFMLGGQETAQVVSCRGAGAGGGHTVCVPSVTARQLRVAPALVGRSGGLL